LRGSLFTGALFRRLFVVTAQLHLAIDAFTLQLLLERPQRLVDIVIAHDDLHKPVNLQNSAWSVCARRSPIPTGL